MNLKIMGDGVEGCTKIFNSRTTQNKSENKGKQTEINLNI